MAKLIDINGFKATIKKVYEDIKAKADKSYVDQSITNLNIDQKANKNEVPAQANFTYQINMVASDQQPSVETSGTYPDLIITFNIPQGQGTGEGTGGSDKPVDTGTPRMWIGYMYWDESGAAGVNTVEAISDGMTKADIDKCVARGGLKEMDPQTFDEYACGKTEQLDDGVYICCIYPEASNFDVLIMVDQSNKTFKHFSEINSEDGSTGYMLCQQGTKIGQINGVSYCQSGTLTSADGLNNYLRVVQL